MGAGETKSFGKTVGRKMIALNIINISWRDLASPWAELLHALWMVAAAGLGLRGGVGSAPPEAPIYFALG